MSENDKIVLMKIKTYYLLILFVIISFLLRISAISTIPYGLNRDEAALAYNAALLKETGKDEWQRSWPMNLESFGDYKLLGYPALLSLFFRVLPENDVVTRLPSILAGSLLPIAIFAFSRRLGIKKNIALIISFLSIVTPVFFFYSRMAYEANLALTLFIFGLSSIFHEKLTKMHLILATCLFIAAFMTYNTPLILFPMILLLLPVFHGIKRVKSWLPAVILLTIVWLFFYFNLSQTISQKSGITLFSDPQVQLDIYPSYRDQFQGFTKQLLGNKYVFYVLKISQNITYNLSPKFLVISGGTHPWHALKGWAHINWVILALLYMFILITLLLAITKLARSDNKEKLIKSLVTKSWRDNNFMISVVVLYLLIVSTVPSAITTDAPHATRSLFFFIMVLIASGLAIEHIGKLIKTNILWGILILYSSITFTFYTYQYFSNYQTISKKLFQSDFISAVNEAERRSQKQIIAVVDQGGYQYIILSWYKKIPAQEFFDTVIRQDPNRIGFRYGERVSRFHFIDKPEDRGQEEELYIVWNDNTNTWNVRK